MSKRDYYEVLGIDKGASESEIKKSPIHWGFFYGVDSLNCVGFEC